jgi:DNA-binding protein WhiA
VLAKNCCQRAYVRGAFLSHGSVTNPERTYHLEIFTEKSEVAERVLLTINSLGLSARMTGRKGDLVVYLKDGDQIVTLLNLMGAHKALLHVENVRIVKDMRNQVNRLVNCETANVDKTIKAAVAQIEAVEKIQKHMDLSELPPKMAEIARLRVENPYASLKELGEMAEPPISKSGVSYRIQQLINMSKSLD